jgi:YVTN family beta-propeller protein
MNGTTAIESPSAATARVRSSESADRYTTTAVILHWLIAVMVVSMIAFGWWMQQVPKNPLGPRVNAFNLHKSLGITIFLVMLLRLAWRMTHRPPPLPAMPGWQVPVARANHVLLYVSLFLMPCAGFMGSALSGRPIVFFGQALPLWFARNDAVSQAFRLTHLVTSWVLVVAIALHVAAALKHHFIDRDRLIARMWPRLPLRWIGVKWSAQVVLPLALTCLGSAALAAPLAYISNEGSASVSVVDVATDKVTTTFKAGTKPRGIALAAGGKELYISDQSSNSLLTIDAATGAVTRRTPLGDSPEAIYLSADGKWLSAAVEENDLVLLIDTATGKVARRLKMRGKNPEHAVFSPDGKWLYVSSEEADSIDIVDLAKGEVAKSVKVGDRPRGIAFLPDGSRAYVAAENADTVNVFDVAQGEVISRIKAGSRSNGVTVNPDGKHVYVSSGGEGTVQVIDTSTNAIIAKIPVGKRPWNMAITADGKKLYVACGRSNAVAVIDTETNTKIAEIPVGELPWGVAIR